jgi:mono/diheme cytochrome c family protein
MFQVRSRAFAALCASVLLFTHVGIRAEEPGLVRTVSMGRVSDRQVTETISLFVPAGQPATPFVAAGPFTARWEGLLNIELRADFVFHAAFSGKLKITVNDSVALEAEGKGDTVVDGQKLRVSKGANKFAIDYSAPESGDAFVRVYWSNKETPFNPIPVSALTCDPDDGVRQSSLVREGRHLFAEHRCIRCHTAPGGMPELAADAPAFAGIGSRRNFDWLARWIEKPHDLRPGTPMPAVFSGTDAREKSEAVAAYLASLKGDTLKASPTDASAIDAGRALYEKLHCVACHNPPDSATTEPGKISQKQVKAKFAAGALTAFLLKPEEHYAWIRMPNFKLSAAEANQLTAYLESQADAPGDRSAPTDEAALKRGQSLVQSVGCLNCHALEQKNEFTAKPLSALAADAWARGCMADEPSGSAPRFAFTVAQRAALRAFAATDRASLTRHTAADFAERQATALNCRECHGKFEGFPAWDHLGGKLRPEWAAKFIAGREPLKPRPWLESRMPAFGAYADHMGVGLATSHGFSPKTGPDEPADAELAKVGQKLVGQNGGFACISCHSVGEFGATQVFEAPGINLAYGYARLQPDFFRRWLRNPAALDSNTKMPAYFDEEGRSAISDVLEGDGPRTIRAVWEYLRLGDAMPKPE